MSKNRSDLTPLRFRWERLLRGAKMPLPYKATLLVLATYGDTNGVDIHPSVERLAQDTGGSMRSISRHLSAGEEAGWIARAYPNRKGVSRNHAQTYLLTFPNLLPPVAGDEEANLLPPVAGDDFNQQSPVAASQAEQQPPVAGNPGHAPRRAPGDASDFHEHSGNIPRMVAECDHQPLVTEPPATGDRTTSHQWRDTRTGPEQRQEQTPNPFVADAAFEPADPAQGSVSAGAAAGDGLRPRGYAAPEGSHDGSDAQDDATTGTDWDAWSLLQDYDVPLPDGQAPPRWAPEERETQDAQWPGIVAEVGELTDTDVERFLGFVHRLDAAAAKRGREIALQRYPDGTLKLLARKNLQYALYQRPLASWPQQVLPPSLRDESASDLDPRPEPQTAGAR